MIFLGLGLAEPVPDATTVWLFRQELKQQGLIEKLFEQLIWVLLFWWYRI
ncbi:MAG: transposase [Richelia sp.]|nr:transposase [Richelia sp.]